MKQHATIAQNRNTIMHAIKASNNAVLNGCSAFLERSSKYSIMVKTANAARNI
jgi:hypothetical protein